MRLAIALFVLSLLMAVAVYARIGGGDSYSGSGDSSSHSSSSDDDRDSGSSYSRSSDDDDSRPSSSGSSGGGGTTVELDGCGVAVICTFFGVIFLFGFIAVVMQERVVPVVSVGPSANEIVRGPADMGGLRRYDPNFSEIVFTDFCYNLFARLYDFLGRGRVDELAPYVNMAVRQGLKRHATPGLSSVTEIVIGSMTVVAFRGLDRLDVEAELEFEANYVENTPTAARRWYVRERWTLERMRDILSPAPANARAEHCPRCGAPLQTNTDGACLHCGTTITDGKFQWFVRSIRSLEKSERPPAIGGSGQETGTNLPTVYQAALQRRRERFLSEHRGFTWQGFLDRVRHVNHELQTAWTTRDWHRARPFETDALFQTHRYWIDEYLRQRKRNIVDEFAIGEIIVVKVTSDAFYDAVTVRIFASGKDYTINEGGAVIGGSPSTTRSWSEYWTFIRGRAGAAADARICPNCGGPLAEGQTAICTYCGGKNTTGEFPWVLSRIEQDEAYRG
ncbi:MAG TPA: zinc-ribbon domain-containing transport protein [Thermoanaerobaculia bacterium]|nr:zinc-ribbon domain-containing transport protein [Thermoanaerobaculia bacterium]